MTLTKHSIPILLTLFVQLFGTAAWPQETTTRPPNIIFIIIDDLGVDQMRSFGYGGLAPPSIPTLDLIAQSGVRFRNTWTMPTCSPSRSNFFTGRYAFRTGVLNAIIDDTDLANSSISPYEATTPKVLKQRGYKSALFGKYHLGGPGNNPAGSQAPQALGWDYFYGFQLGAVPFVDTTAGGVAPEGTYSCGFVTDAAFGACYQPDGRCTELGNINAPQGIAGRTCLEQGGLFVKNAACGTPPDTLNFEAFNGYYVWPLTVNNEDGSLVRRNVRRYLEVELIDEAIRWIKDQPPRTPWMVTLSLGTIHTPYQYPPQSLQINLPSNLVCSGSNGMAPFILPEPLNDRALANAMLTALDQEIARMMVELGLARRTPTGLDYRPEATDTMIIFVGDNGSYNTIVRAPFDLARSKGTPYQTGVWAPLAVAGPLVAQSKIGTAVEDMINGVDLYRLFAEIAGANPDSAVPRGRIIDGQPMLHYLHRPLPQRSRLTNFTQQGNNLKTPEAASALYACFIAGANLCTDTIFNSKDLCETQAGTWYGPGGAGGDQTYRTCCDLQNATGQVFNILPLNTWAMRNDRYKLVQSELANCTTGGSDLTYEFYEIDQQPVNPKLDREQSNLLTASSLPPQGLTTEQRANFSQLLVELRQLLASEAPCPGDGNLDKRVDRQDLIGWGHYRGLGSTVFDFNFDGQTDEADARIIQANLGRSCRPTTRR